MRNEIAAGSMVALASRIGHATLTGLCATVLLSGTVGPSPAAEANALALDGLHALPDSTLDSLRGGFQVGSFELAIGITISTAINGAPVLHTSFNVVGPNQIDNVRMRGPQGPIGPQNPIGPQGAVGPKEPTGPQGTVGPNGTPGPVTVAPTTGGAKEPVSNSPAGSDSFAIGEVPGGIRVNTSGTQIMHQVDNGVLTRIMNVADGQRISHATAINIAATNFSEVIGGAAIRAQINNLAIESARIGLIAN